MEHILFEKNMNLRILSFKIQPSSTI